MCVILRDESPTVAVAVLHVDMASTITMNNTIITNEIGTPDPNQSPR